MDDLESLYKSGASYQEIAEKLGISRSSVWRRIKKSNLIGSREEYEDLTNKRYGKLIVLSFSHTGRYKDGGVFRVWTCLCDCGNTIKVRAGNLKAGQRFCKLCASKSLSDDLKKCVIDYRVWYRIIDRCRRGNLDFNITPEYLDELFKDQNGKCALSGEDIFFGVTRTSECTASPDRIDPKKGYIKGNIRWVHKYVNIMRNDKDTEEFVNWCKKIVNYNNHD